MKKFDLKSMGIGAVVGVACMLAIGAASARPLPMEYAVVPGIVHSGELQTKMNRYSGEDWEFVSTAAIGDLYGYAIFRRPKP